MIGSFWQHPVIGPASEQCCPIEAPQISYKSKGLGRAKISKEIRGQDQEQSHSATVPNIGPDLRFTELSRYFMIHFKPNQIKGHWDTITLSIPRLLRSLKIYIDLQTLQFFPTHKQDILEPHSNKGSYFTNMNKFFKTKNKSAWMNYSWIAETLQISPVECAIRIPTSRSSRTPRDCLGLSGTPDSGKPAVMAWEKRTLSKRRMKKTPSEK